MPAKSKAQQQFFGMVHAMQKGDMPKKGHAGEVAKTISKKDAKDFASTPTKGLPKKVKEETGKYAKTLFTADKKPIFIDDKYFDKTGTELIVKNDNYHGKVYVYDANQKDKFFIDPKDLYFERPKKVSKLKEASEIIPNSIRYEISKIIDKLYNKNRNTIKMNGRIIRTTSTTPLKDIKDELESHGYTPEQIAWGMGIAKDQGLKEASLRSKFKSGQTVIAKSNHQGLKNGEEYKVSDVDVTWLLGQGYTTVTVRDKFGKEFVVNNPQVALIVKNAPSSYYKTHDGIGRPIKEEITDWTTVKNEYWYKDKNRALAVKKYLESKGVKPKLYAAGNRYKLKWEWTKIQQDSIPASELEEDNENRGLLKILRADLDEVENEQLKGGLSADKSYSDFDQEQLAKGIKVEIEHTDDPSIAKEIAADHLAEIPDYYDRLEKMEREAGIDEGTIKMAPMIKKRLNENKVVVLLPDGDTEVLKNRIMSVAKPFEAKSDFSDSTVNALRLQFPNKAKAVKFHDKAKQLFSRSGVKLELQEDTDSGWSHASENSLSDKVALGIFKRVYHAKSKDEIKQLLDFYSKKYPHLKNAFARMAQHAERELK